jgi:hypothetical protein
MQPGQQQNQNQQQQQQQQSGRRGEPGHEGGASKQGHLRPDIDATEGKDDGRAERDRQIAQERQQSSGQGSGQS